MLTFMLIFQSDDNASFLRAARGGNLEKVLEYLKANTDINTCNAVSCLELITNKVSHILLQIITKNCPNFGLVFL